MIDHLDGFNKILADLLNLDIEIEDEDKKKALLLLNSLSDMYDHLTTTLLYGKEKISFVEVSNALVNNEYMKKDKETCSDTSSEALIVRSRPRSKSTGASTDRYDLTKDQCAYCHKKRH
ncbi:hypothetical protein ACSBR2_038582 [Camellia fascicularis]